MATRDELIAQGFEPDDGMTTDDLKAAGFEPEEEGGTWWDETRHALARGSFQAAASVPGTLATLMEAGSSMPGSWGQMMSNADQKKEDEKNRKAVKNLRRSAKNIYNAASAPSLRQKKKGVGGYIFNTMLETAPVLIGSTAAGVVAGPAGSFSVGAFTMGEDAYQEAKKNGASDETANTERLIVGMIGGALERVQADEVLKLGKVPIRSMIQAAKERAWKKLGKQAGKYTVEQLAGAASEGLTEALQQGTQVAASALHGENPFTVEHGVEVGMAALGGVTAGGMMKGAHSLLTGNVSAEASPEEDVTGNKFVTIDGIMAQEEQTVEPRPAGAKPYEDEPVTAPKTMDKLGEEMRGDQPELPVADEAVHVQERPQIPANKDVSTQPEAAQDENPSAPPTVEVTEDELADSSPDMMSARQADIQAHRSMMGLDEVERQESRAWAEASRLAKERGMNRGKAASTAAVLRKKPRPIDDVTTAGMVDVMIELENEYDAIDEKIGKETDQMELDELIEQRNRIQSDYDMISEAVHYSGSEKGRALAAQKLTKDREFRLVSVIGKATALKGGPLTEAETTELTGKVKELQETAKKAEEAQVKENTADAEEQIKGVKGVKLFGKPILDSVRYRNMTEDEKDAELTKLLAKKRTPENIAKIAINLATRKGVKNLEDVCRAVERHDPKVTWAMVTDALAVKKRNRKRVTHELALRLQAIKKEARQLTGNYEPGLRKAISNLLGYLDKGTLPPVKGQSVDTASEAVRQLRLVRDSLRKLLRVSEPAVQKKLQGQIDYLQERINEGDFGPKMEPPKSEVSTKTLELQYRVAKLRQQIRERQQKLHKQTAYDLLLEPFRLVQSIRASGDVSAVGRQSGWMLITHPIRSAKIMPDMVRAMFSEQEAFRIDQELQNRANAPRYWRAGLEFTHAEGPLTEREEMHHSRWADRFPGVKGSNRAFSTYLNLMRANSFDIMTDAFTARGKTLSLVEDKAMADFINMATGRAAIRSGQMKVMANTLNGVLWSPRYVASRFQLVSGYAFLHGSNAVRRAIAEEYARYLLGMGVAYTLGMMCGAELEMDPRSSDFGKLKFGNTRIDPLSGLSQTLVFATRYFKGETKNADGEIIPLRGDDVPYGGDTVADVAFRYFRTKLAPGAAFLLDAPSGENVVGEKRTWGSTFESVAVPMAWADIYGAAKELGIPAASILGPLTMLGVGVQTYETKSSGEEGRGTW